MLMAYLKCVDGFCMSVINAEHQDAYGIGSDEDTVEIDRLNQVEDLLKPYACLYTSDMIDDNDNLTEQKFTNAQYINANYQLVPRRLVNAIIFLHGGLTFEGEAFYSGGALRDMYRS